MPATVLNNSAHQRGSGTTLGQGQGVNSNTADTSDNSGNGTTQKPVDNSPQQSKSGVRHACRQERAALPLGPNDVVALRTLASWARGGTRGRCVEPGMKHILIFFIFKCFDVLKFLCFQFYQMFGTFHFFARAPLTKKSVLISLFCNSIFSSSRFAFGVSLSHNKEVSSDATHRAVSPPNENQ